MSSPKFLISYYLSNAENNNIEGLRKYLIENSMMSKDYPDEGLFLVYHKYDIPSLSEVERECRSLIIDRNTLKIIAYSCETPIMNMAGLDLVLNSVNQSQPPIITECWEGSLLSMYKHNDKWYVSSRRCLNASVSTIHSPDGVQVYNLYDMMMEVITGAGFKTFEEFTETLNPKMSYYWVLIHHNNKLTIDYTERLGENYAKLCLISIRDENMVEQDLTNLNEKYLSETIFVSPQMPFSEVSKYTNFSLEAFGSKPTTEGLAIKVWNEECHKYNLVKLQTPLYQFSQITGIDNVNIIKGLIYLYQNGKLKDYLTTHPEQSKIENPQNTSQSYDVIGVIDSAFKASASELFELFKLLWSIQTGQKIPEAKFLYDMMPKEYKDMLYNIKGIYYRKKAESHNQENQDVPTKNHYLRPTDIYNYMKTLPTEKLIQYWKIRRTMMDDALTRGIFPQIQTFCEKIQLKLLAIMTSKLA